MNLRPSNQSCVSHCGLSKPRCSDSFFDVEDFQFDPNATTVSTPVEEVFQKKAGVCQDFAHFQIACFRSLGLPARYISGYLRTIPPPGQSRMVGADASHAWASVYCGPAGWFDFDPTNNLVPETDHITIGWGRDYSDICPCLLYTSDAADE